MSKLSEMIATLCPNGVEYKKIKDAYTRLRGTSITATQMKAIGCKDGEIRIFAGGKTVVDAREEDIPNANITRVPAVLVQSRGVIDFVFYDKPFTFKNEMWAYTAKDVVSVKYLYYVLQNSAEHFREAASGMGAFPQISLKVTEDFSIPLPPLPIQREIVQILDNFANLTAELTAELAKRKKQYEHYRDMLLNFTGEERVCKVEWKRLGEVCEVLDNMRKPVTKKDRLPGPYPYYGANGIQDYVADYLFDGTYLLIGEDGSVITEKGTPVLTWAEGKIWVNNHAHVICEAKQKNGDPKALLRYLYHSLQTVIISDVVHGTPPKLNKANLSDIKIPLPPLEEQAAMVSLLDKFDSLCNSLTEGLPAEIELRKKQYEYYRDKLLSFKEAG